MKRGNCFIVIVFLCSFLFNSNVVTIANEKEDNVLSNDYIVVNLEDEKESTEYLRFKVLTEKGSVNTNEDDNKKLTYNNFASSYTTININEKSYIFGQGDTIEEPKYNEKTSSIKCSQKFGDILVTQELELVTGFTYGFKDMVKITYNVDNLGEEKALVGIRLMIDPFIGQDDKGLIEIDNEAIMAETNIFGADFKGVWQIKSNYENVVAYGKSTENNYDSITFANWDKLYDNRWNYEVNEVEAILDSAVAMTWNEELLEANSSRTMDSTYGVKNEIQEEINEEVIGESEFDLDNINSAESGVLGASEMKTGDENNLIWIILSVLVSITVIAVIVKVKIGGKKND